MEGLMSALGGAKDTLDQNADIINPTSSLDQTEVTIDDDNTDPSDNTIVFNATPMINAKYHRP